LFCQWDKDFSDNEIREMARELNITAKRWGIDKTYELEKRTETTKKTYSDGSIEYETTTIILPKEI